MDGIFERYSVNYIGDTAGTEEAVAAPEAQGTSLGQTPRLVIRKAIVSSSGAQAVTIKSGSTTILGPVNILAGDTVDLGNMILKCNVLEAINITLGASEDTTVYMEYERRA